MQENTNKQEEEFKGNVDDLPAAFELFRPEKIVVAGKFMGYMYGGRKLTQVIQFKEQVKFKNPQIDYFMGLPPHRLEGENFVKYKQRTRFQRALYRFRKYIYEFDMRTKKQKPEDASRKETNT